MKKYLYHLCTVFCLITSAQLANAKASEDIVPVTPVQPAIYLAAGNCTAHANALASSYANATILSVTDNGGSCTIVIRVKDSGGGHPRIIKKTVSG